MGKKKKKVSTETEDSGQIELTESSEVPVSTKEESKVLKDEAKESLAEDVLPPETVGKEEAAPVPEKLPDLEPVEEMIPESKKEQPAMAAKPAEDGERVDVGQIIDEEVGVKPKGGKKAKKSPKKKGKEQKEAVIEKPETPESIELKDLEFPDFEDDDETVPDLIESMKAQEAKPREAWKILFSGLDFAGKSSIIATVKNEFEKIVNPQPTKLTERSEFTFLGQSVHDWDMGGQRLYRIQYLKRPMMYYADTSVLFYVIDVLDEERYDEAIDFLYDTLQLFDKLNVNPLISILFHKFDPDVERDSKKNRIELKITALTNKIKVLAYGRDILFYRTSIFNKYSVIEAFSRTLLQLFPDKNLVDYALAELAQKTGANIIIILDETRLILGKNIIESDDIQYDELVKLAQNTLLSFLYLNENFQFYPFLKSNYLIIQLEKYSFLWSQIEENGHSFYIIVFKDGAKFDELLKMDVQSVAKTLMKLVKKP
ncbi:MAG TPA: ADP-ribosylation factor-like protein [Candidatus Lokiarchaeia archaeon]|nr:ADP-ribosylation factor-like protein [Candidatus Lokiarchaeia archaeon]